MHIFETHQQTKKRHKQSCFHYQPNSEALFSVNVPAMMHVVRTSALKKNTQPLREVDMTLDECPSRVISPRVHSAAVSPAPIPADKRVREQRPRQTEDLGIHILKAAGTRLQQGVPLTLFIHLRSSGAGAAVAGPERMARATRYLYNKPGDNVRVRGTTPPKTLRGVESIGERERRRARGREEDGENAR